MDFFGAIFFQKKPKDHFSLKIPSKNQADKTEPQVKKPTTQRDSEPLFQREFRILKSQNKAYL